MHQGSFAIVAGVVSWAIGELSFLRLGPFWLELGQG